MKMSHPKPSFTPSGVAFISDFCKVAADRAAVDTAAAILSHHSDPIVAAAIGIIQRLCIDPWNATLNANPELTIIPSIPEIFEFTLRDERSAIGSYADAALQISLLPPFFAFVTKSSEVDGDWVLELSVPSGDEVYRLNVIRGESWPDDQREDVSLKAGRSRYKNGPETSVRPGDMIVIEKLIKILILPPMVQE